MNFLHHLNKGLVAVSCAFLLSNLASDLLADEVQKSGKESICIEGHRGERGKRGERGRRGHAGPTGATGATGAIGATGPTGPANGLNAFAGAVSIADPSARVVVASGADIPLPDNTVTSNINLIGTTGFQVTQAGDYEISYGVVPAVAALLDIGIAIDGVVNPDTVLAPPALDTDVSGSFILSLAAGQIITIRNSSLLTLTLAPTPSVGAFITIKKLD